LAGILQEGLGPDCGLVGSFTGDPLFELTLTLAFDLLGLPSLSIPTAFCVRNLSNIAERQGVIIVSDADAPAGFAGRWLTLSARDYLSGAGAMAVEMPLDGDLASARLVLSSGTTGVARASLFDEETCLRRLAISEWLRHYDPSSRHLASIPLSSIYGYTQQMAVLVAGGTRRVMCEM